MAAPDPRTARLDCGGDVSRATPTALGADDLAHVGPRSSGLARCRPAGSYSCVQGWRRRGVVQCAAIVVRAN